MAYTKVLINSDKLSVEATNSDKSINNVMNSLAGILGSVETSTVSVQGTATQATAKLGFMGATGIGPDQTVVINGVVFTAKDTGASGPAQFNVGVTGPNFANTASFLAAKINGHTGPSLYGNVTAVASGVTGLAYVTLTAVEPGICGNGFTATNNGSGATGLSTFVGGSVSTTVSK